MGRMLRVGSFHHSDFLAQPDFNYCGDNMTSPETMLRAANLAFPGRPWMFAEGQVITQPYCHGPCCRFNPHDPTKGDLAALNEALLKAGWEFGHSDLSGYFEATWSKGRIGRRIEAPTPAELALLCVEAMP